MKRLFTAIKIYPDEGFIQSFRELKRGLSHEKIKWVEEYNIHITLKFFGETEEKRILEIKRVMEQIAGQTDVFQISLSGLGIFGSRYSPRVIWTGLEPYRFLTDFIGKIQSGLEPIGYPADRQNLVPHLTLGRVNQLNDKAGFHKLIDRSQKIVSAPILVRQFILFESILMKTGPKYLTLETFELRTKNSPDGLSA